MTEKKPDHNTAIVVVGDRHLTAPRSKLIRRGLEIAESLYRPSETVVRDIIVEIDYRGFLKKRAILDSVSIEGEPANDVSLGFVFKRIEDYDIRIGDTVSIESIGGYPKLVKGKRTGNEILITMPVKCPACGSKIESLQPDSACYCTGNACPGRIKAQIMAFSDSMGIILNPELVKELVDKRMILDSADLYFLKKKDLMRLNKMDEDSAQRILDAIEKSRHSNLSRIIIALLETVGVREVVAIEVACRCKSINDLFDADTLAQMKSYWIKPDDVIAIKKLMNAPTTLKFLGKLKRGGVIFPRKSVD